MAKKYLPTTQHRYRPLQPSWHTATADQRLKTAAPTHGGELVSKLECDNVVASVYRHADDPNYGFTVTIERKYVRQEDGKVITSPRLTSADLGAVRALTTDIGHAMQNREADPAEDRMKRAQWDKADNRWSARRDRDPSDHGRS